MMSLKQFLGFIQNELEFLEGKSKIFSTYAYKILLINQNLLQKLHFLLWVI